MKPEIPMHSGKMFNFEKLNFEDVTPLDLLVPLSRMPRWGGSGDQPLTVLQHTLLVESISRKYGEDRDLRYACLCHDLLEALYHDIRSPLKMLLPDYNRLYAEAEAKFYELVGVDILTLPGVKHIDQVALMVEQRFAFPKILLTEWGWDKEMPRAFEDYACEIPRYERLWEEIADLSPGVTVQRALRLLRNTGRSTFWCKENV